MADIIVGVICQEQVPLEALVVLLDQSSPRFNQIVPRRVPRLGLVIVHGLAVHRLVPPRDVLAPSEERVGHLERHVLDCRLVDVPVVVVVLEARTQQEFLGIDDELVVLELVQCDGLVVG